MLFLDQPKSTEEATRCQLQIGEVSAAGLLWCEHFSIFRVYVQTNERPTRLPAGEPSQKGELTQSFTRFTVSRIRRFVYSSNEGSTCDLHTLHHLSKVVYPLSITHLSPHLNHRQSI